MKLARSPHRKVLISICLAVVVALAIGWQFVKLHCALSMVPDALEVSSVSYSKEESWGMGPGAAETGLLVYPLGVHMSEQITEQNIAFFKTMPAIENQYGRRGEYAGWQQTPLTGEISTGYEDEKVPISLESYLDQRGYGIAIDPEVTVQVNQILLSPGAYYAYGRNSMIVVSPKEQLVVYMYIG